jgi:hypothetical protein
MTARGQTLVDAASGQQCIVYLQQGCNDVHDWRHEQSFHLSGVFGSNQ